MLYAGQRIGKYVVRGTLGSGGMAVVYRAWDEYMHREVALKFLAADAAEADFADRFDREIRLLAQIEHDNVVCIFDVIPVKDGHCYAMELVEGSTVESLLVEARREERQGLGVDTSLVILRGVARALAAAHAKGVLHRDVKPANVILDAQRERPVLVDFGLARGGGQATLTLEGTVLGTLFYLSPEQVRGERMTCAGDVYQWGVMAWHLLVGHLPFEDDDDMTAAMRRVSEGLPSLASQCPDLPPELVTIVGRATEIHPSARYQDGAALTEALEAFMIRSGRLAAPLWSPPGRPGFRRPLPPPPPVSPPVVTEQLPAARQGPAPHLRGEPTVALGAVPPPAPSRAERRRLAWLTPLIVVVVLGLQYGSPLGTQWPPRSLDVRSSASRARVTIVTGRPVLTGFRWFLRTTSAAGPGAGDLEGSVGVDRCAVGPGRYQFELTGLTPSSTYRFEVGVAGYPALALVGTEVRTKPLPVSRMALRGTGSGLVLTATALRPCTLTLQSRGLVSLDYTTRATSPLALEHALPWTGDPQLEQHRVIHEDDEGANLLPLNAPELVDRGLDELRASLRDHLPEACLGGDARLPTPELLAGELDRILLRENRGSGLATDGGAGPATVGALLDRWLAGVLPLLRRDAPLLRLFLESTSVASDRRGALAAGCASIAACDWYRQRRGVPGAVTGAAEAMPGFLKAADGVPEGFRVIGNKRFEVNCRIYHAAERSHAVFLGSDDRKSWAIDFTVGRNERLPRGAVAAVCLESDELTSGFVPVVEVAGIPLYLFGDPAKTAKRSCTFPPGILREGPGNGLKLRLIPAGRASERVSARSISFFADRDPEYWPR